MDLKKTLKGATIKVCRWGKKNAPEILMGAGIVGMVTGTFVAVRITQKKVVPRKNECVKRTDDIVDKDLSQSKRLMQQFVRKRSHASWTRLRLMQYR